jgi:hypothetical protein
MIWRLLAAVLLQLLSSGSSVAAQVSSTSASVCRYRSINHILDSLPLQCPTSNHLPQEPTLKDGLTLTLVISVLS